MTVVDRELASLRKQGLWLLREAEFTWKKSQVRPLLWAAQKGICYCGCGRVLVSHYRDCRSGDRDTIDHVWPTGRGGADALGNIALATHNCNDRKGSRMPTKEQLKSLERINLTLSWPTRWPDEWGPC